MSCGCIAYPRRILPRQAGIALLELMLALLLLATGILAAASVQLQARWHGLEAEYQLVAATLAADLMARVSANLAGVAVYQLSPTTTGSVSTTDCRAQDCPAPALAAWDLQQWRQTVAGGARRVEVGGSLVNAGGLPDARVCLSAGGSHTRLVISWRGPLPSYAQPMAACPVPPDSYGQGNRYLRQMALTSFNGSIP
jgi:type IV pilus assembly protein PilV